MNKPAYFYIDDVIWVFRDVTRSRPASLFDNPFLRALKTARDRFGVKTQLNVFYRTDAFYGNDDFSLADMTDAYRDEWEAASDWLHLSFHAKQEFPDYPHVNVTYRDMTDMLNAADREIVRFAGEKTLGRRLCNPHWLPVSRAGCQALFDHGVRVVNATAGEKRAYGEETEKGIPDSARVRLLQGRTPEAGVLPGAYICLAGHNHFSTETENAILGTTRFVPDPETGLSLKRFTNKIVLNALTREELARRLDEEIGKEYVGAGLHEQYFYPDYFAYQPDYADKIFAMGKALSESGYAFCFVEELLR